MSDYLGLPVKFPTRCNARCRQPLNWTFSEYDDEGATSKTAVFVVPACTRCGMRHNPQRISVPLDWEPIPAES